MLDHLQRSLQPVLHPGYADAGATVAAPTVSTKLAAKCSSTSQLTHSWVFRRFLSPSLKANCPPPWLLLRRPLALRPATSSLPGTPRRPRHLHHHRSCRIRRPPSRRPPPPSSSSSVDPVISRPPPAPPRPSPSPSRLLHPGLLLRSSSSADNTGTRRRRFDRPQ
jgi:hypothetical protein